MFGRRRTTLPSEDAAVALIEEQLANAATRHTLQAIGEVVPATY